MSEKAVRIAAQLYEARTAMRSLLGDRYRERCLHWVDCINRTMQRQGCDEITAALTLAKELSAQGGTPFVLFATVVEMIEGIFAPPAIGAVVSYQSTHPAHPGKVATGKATVVKYMTAANAPAPHMRPTERTLWVRGCDHGPMHGQHFIIKASEVVS